MTLKYICPSLLIILVFQEEKVAADLCSTIMDKWSKSIRTANVEPQEIGNLLPYRINIE